MGLVDKVYYDGGRDALVVLLGSHYNFITTLPYQPREANAIVFKRVQKDFRCDDLKSFYGKLRVDLGYNNSIVFLTAAPVDDHLYVVNNEGTVAVIATVGLEPPVCPGYGNRYEPLMGTINVAVVVDYSLTYSALVDLLRVVVEAKSVAVSELLLRCDVRSPGTATDAIAVGGRLVEGDGYINMGMLTTVGGWVSGIVYRGLVGIGLRRLGLEGLLRNIIGLSLDELVNLVVELYKQAPIPGVTVESVRVEARRLIEGILRDPNVWSLLVAAREMDLHAMAGSIPWLEVEDHLSDSKAVVADELLAFALSLYIAGFRGLLATYWVERLKERGLIALRLPQFEDDVVSALVGSTLSILYTRLLGGGG